MAIRSAQRLGGVLMTDHRSASEAVMIMWLAPPRESALGKVLRNHIILGTLYIKKGERGLDFDSSSTPVLSGPDGYAKKLVEAPAPEMESVLRRLKARLKSRQSPDSSLVLETFAERLGFFIFEKGMGRVGPGWTVTYAGRTYPMRAA